MHIFPHLQLEVQVFLGQSLTDLQIYLFILLLEIGGFQFMGELGSHKCSLGLLGIKSCC